MSKKIYVPKQDPHINKSGVIKISPEAVDVLLKISQNTNMNIRSIASMIIVQAYENNLISYDNEELDE